MYFIFILFERGRDTERQRDGERFSIPVYFPNDSNEPEYIQGKLGPQNLIQVSYQCRLLSNDSQNMETGRPRLIVELHMDYV